MRARCCWTAALPPPPPGLPVAKHPPAKAGDTRDAGSIPGSGRSLGGGNGNPLQYPCPENPHGQRNLAGYSPWGHKKLDVTEHTHPGGTTRPLDIDPRVITAITGERMIVPHDNRSDRNSKTRQRSRFSPLRLTKFRNGTFCCKTLGKEYSHGWLLWTPNAWRRIWQRLENDICTSLWLSNPSSRNLSQRYAAKILADICLRLFTTVVFITAKS